MSKSSETLVTLVVPASPKPRKRQARRRKSVRDWKVKVYDSSDRTAVNVVLKE